MSALAELGAALESGGVWGGHLHLCKWRCRVFDALSQAGGPGDAGSAVVLLSWCRG
jgi:hypothetical protein